MTVSTELPQPREFIDESTTSKEYPFLPRSKLQKLRCNGEGPQYFKLGRRVVYARGDVEAWIRSHARQSTSEAAQ